MSALAPIGAAIAQYGLLAAVALAGDALAPAAPAFDLCTAALVALGLGELFLVGPLALQVVGVAGRRIGAFLEAADTATARVAVALALALLERIDGTDRVVEAALDLLEELIRIDDALVGQVLRSILDGIVPCVGVLDVAFVVVLLGLRALGLAVLADLVAILALVLALADHLGNAEASFAHVLHGLRGILLELLLLFRDVLHVGALGAFGRA